MTPPPIPNSLVSFPPQSLSIPLSISESPSTPSVISVGAAAVSGFAGREGNGNGGWEGDVDTRGAEIQDEESFEVSLCACEAGKGRGAGGESGALAGRVVEVGLDWTTLCGYSSFATLQAV